MCSNLLIFKKSEWLVRKVLQQGKNGSKGTGQEALLVQMRDDGNRKKQRNSDYIVEINSQMTYEKLKCKFEEDTSAN